MKRFFTILLLTLSVCLSGGQIPPSLGKQWLERPPTERFNILSMLAVEAEPGYQERLLPYLQARGVYQEEEISALARQDLLHIAHALSVLFDHDHGQILQEWLGEHIHLIDGCKPQIDHVGRELLGPLSFYLPLLKKIAPQLRLVYLRDLVFPSTQVVKVLRQHDPNLREVAIGRVYFQNVSDNRIGCIEAFQTAPLDETMPQPIKATQERLALLTSDKNSSTISPIDHISVALDSIEEVQKIHQRILDHSSSTLRPAQMKVSHNPADGSMNTKVLLRDSPESAFSKIIEFVHYAK